MQIRKLHLICGLTGLLITDVACSQNYITEFDYDARGRLIQLSNNTGKDIIYTLDEAGNRTAMVDSTVSPSITSFNAPVSVRKGQSATVSWVSVNTTYCTLAIFGDITGYEYLPITGSVSFRVHQPIGVSVKCYAGEKYSSAGKRIGINGGGPIP